MSSDKKHVIKVAQPGYDVKTTGDENLIYSSEWPLLKIYKDSYFKVSDVSQTTVIADHDLGFVPVFWYFSNTALSAWSNSGVLTQESRSEFFGPDGPGTISVNSTSLKYNGGSGGATGSLPLHYYLFTLDLTKQYKAPIIKVGSVGGLGDNKNVFKLAKPTKDINSNNLEDFIIHSRARSPMIHSVNPSNGGTSSFIVEHNLGYSPMFFGYLKNTDGSYSLIPSGQGGSSSLKSSEKTVTYTSATADEISIVILKDPFVLDYSIRISI